MTALATTNGQALVERIPQRNAWRILQADFSNAQGITKDRWLVLETAFRGVDDDLLTQAVLQHCRDNPGLFPRIGDLYKIIRQLEPPTMREVFLDSMRRAGYRLESDRDYKMNFNGTGGRTAVVHY
jgi:hypothetical protein